MNGHKILILEETPKTPSIDFNRMTGELIMSGKSIPENSAKFYEPLMEWINDYILSPPATTNLRLNLEYFNTASSIWIVKMIRQLGRIDDPEKVLVIHVYINEEDVDSFDDGEINDIVNTLTEDLVKPSISVYVKVCITNDEGTPVKERIVYI